ncbi:MAG: hypothetical protein ACRDPO_17905, partial [Streptosporangiaceae bacterium]
MRRQTSTRIGAAALAGLVLTVAGCATTSSGQATRPARSVSTSMAPTSSVTPREAAGGSTSASPQADVPPRTSCHSVVHIGDSTSDGLVLPAFQPDAKLRIAAQYRRVGVTHFVPEVSGARSLVETWHGIPNGYTVAQNVLRRGFHGCWVIALGTNDTANVAVGSEVGLAARITSVMRLLSPQAVMWVNVVSLLHSGPYAESRMRDWDRALLHACLSYPNMKVYDWAAVARRKWFINDGIHYTPSGYAARSRMIANALAKAFPAGQPLPPPPLPLPAYMIAKRSTSAPNCLV